ncbi:hypothetical protein LCGC14_1249850, partial [marine sediment metagenome]
METARIYIQRRVALLVLLLTSLCFGTGGDLEVKRLFVGSGTVASPTVAFVNATGTGLYHSGSGDGEQLNFSIAGTQRVYITGAGLGLDDQSSANFGILSFSGTAMTADRVLTTDLDNANRTIKNSGNLIVESASIINQDVTSDADVSFNTINSIGISAPSTTSITFAPSDGLASSELKYSSLAGIQWSLTNPVVSGIVLTISGNSSLNQNLLQASSPTFAGLTLDLTQDYLFTNRGSGFAIQGQTSGNSADFEFYTGAGDGTKDILLRLFALGSPTDVTNSETLRIGFDASYGALSDIYVIHGTETNTGVLHPIHIFADGGAGADQFILNIDGTNSMAGDLTVNDLIIGDARFIGSASDTDAIQIEADGDVVLTQDATVTGILFVSEFVSHLGDPDTTFAFTTDTFQINAGGEGMMHATSGKDSNVTFNLNTLDVDWRVNSQNVSKFLAVDASADTFTVGDGGITNYMEVSGTGDVVFVGSAGLAFGEIYARDNTATTSTSTTKAQILIFDTDGESNNMTPDHAQDHITVTKAGMYKIDA